MDNGCSYSLSKAGYFLGGLALRRVASDSHDSTDLTNLGPGTCFVLEVAGKICFHAFKSRIQKKNKKKKQQQQQQQVVPQGFHVFPQEKKKVAPKKQEKKTRVSPMTPN